ncbi:MAG: methylmalonyl-CoA mutase, partial [Pseudomonadota bacterium]
QPARRLPAERLSEPFETLRDESDAYLESNGTRPAVFLATLGTLASFTTSVTYARNFLAAGGIDVVQGPEDASTDAIVEAFGASGAVVAVICSAASDVSERAPDLAEALSAAGARDVYVVGRSSAEEPDAAPISAYLYDGCDMPALLREMMTRMEVVSK